MTLNEKERLITKDWKARIRRQSQEGRPRTLSGPEIRLYKELCEAEEKQVRALTTVEKYTDELMALQRKTQGRAMTSAETEKQKALLEGIKAISQALAKTNLGELIERRTRELARSLGIMESSSETVAKVGRDDSKLS